MLSFTLPDEFVETYAKKTVKWGYLDAGGSSLGEITFLRTYSRLKPDGTKERWHEVCRRVIEGMYSIQKDHCKSNRLPWNDHKAQRSARDAYDRLFNFKWTPPGRGLWIMGTPLVNEERNSAALQNCFTGGQEFLTPSGLMPLGELVGHYSPVWTGSAAGWVKAEVRSFGVQNVQRITLAPAMSAGADGWRGARSNHRIDIVVTPNHRWELTDGTTTTTLREGDFVPAAGPRALQDFPEWDNAIYDDGFRHGLMFGDGSLSYKYKDGSFSYMMRLCGGKANHVSLFENVHYQSNCDGDPVVYMQTRANLKSVPTAGTRGDYIHGFIKGWLATDAYLINDVYKLATQDAQAAEWVKQHAPYAGLVVSGHSINSVDTNYGVRSAPLNVISLALVQNRAWKVVGIEALDQPQEVFCAVVPGPERFTLAGGILTSNCAFVSTGDMTKTDPSGPFCFLMEASMLGVGVGFDDKGADKGFTIYKPDTERKTIYQIPDSREGWVESVEILIQSYLMPGRSAVQFLYGLIRPAGEPIKTFGGTAAGPEPLLKLHHKIREIFDGRDGQLLTRTDIADLGNLIGVCVVSGNVRRSAELLIGRIDDKEFINLKNHETNPRRGEWSWMSNNSVEAKVGDDYSHLVDAIALNGEPGIIWMDTTRKYGRLIDPPTNKDHRAAGYNPCAEQSLESYEMCTLVETYMGRHESLEDFQSTLKYAFMYAKTVTLLPTHWQRTNAIMQRNRRIGCSVSGIANFTDNQGMTALRTWLNTGYATVQQYDRVYSEWLCVRESIKTTTVKPSGTVSILAGESPGVHWAPGGEHFHRAIRFAKTDPMVELFRQAGYTVEPDVKLSDTTVVVYFPIRSQARRAEGDVSLFEKANLAVVAQRYWSDNSVSVTLSFNPETEAEHVGTVLHMHEGQLKTVSFLPSYGGVYPQMPYTAISAQQYDDATMKLFKVDLSPIYDGLGVEAIGEQFCTTDVCLVKQETAEAR